LTLWRRRTKDLSTDFTEDTEKHDAPLFETPNVRVLEMRGGDEEI